MNQTPLKTIIDLHTQASTHFQRRALVLQGSENAICDLVSKTIQHCVVNSAIALNADQYNWPAVHVSKLDMKQGKSILGLEIDCLIVVLDERFDANGFSAAIGSLKAGGLLILVDEIDVTQGKLSQRWLSRAIKVFPKLTLISDVANHETLAIAEHSDISVPSIQSPFSQQNDAIEAIVKVVQGHRKRPLVLTADRGRGKTAALGKAAAKLLQIRPLSILVTAPNAKSIEPLFRHLAIDLGVTYSKNSCAFNGGSIKFIAPDELLSGLPKCDLLLVDEAGALPLPTLMALTQNYHRMVFSTTVHGYEGCGRGFTLKFNKWLSENRPGFSSMHLHQPIRWAEDDPVEQWLFDCFLFNTEISQHMSVDITNTKYEVISATRLFEQPELLNQAVALLVNAHYQTSPNDILQILDNPQLSLLMAHANKQCLGVVLFVHEEALAPSVIDAVQLGKARPKGQLFSTYIANHLGFREAATASSYRIMRIAVHPNLQRQGIGRRLLEHVEQIAVHDKAYVATSFGLTSDVLSFWISNKFIPLSLGTRKDAASGTYSLFLAKPLNELQHEWIKSASMVASLQVKSLLSSVYQSLGFTELATLLKAYSRNDTVPNLSKQEAQQLLNFSQGGSALYSVKASLENLVFLSIHYLVPSLLLIDLVLKQKPHKVIISEHHFLGKNELELKVRAEVSNLLADLQCKFSF